MSDSLPWELLFNIFLKLPSETLIVCTCVSKSWRSLIADRAFITSHLNRTRNSRDNRLLLLRRCFGSGSKKGERYSLHFDSETLEMYKELDFPFENWNENFKLVGFCDGLLCLVGPNIFLWNPSIQRSVAVPWPSDSFATNGTPYKHALGFGFDSRASDFKLVRLLYPEAYSMYGYVISPKVQLFELRTGSWRPIVINAPCYETSTSQGIPNFLNGAVHWVASSRSYRRYHCIILRFHMANESFSTISLPDCLVNEWPHNLKVAVLGGELAVLQQSGCFGNRYLSSVWMLRKYGVPELWSRLMSVDPSQWLKMALGCRENGDLLMTSRDGEMVSYKPENQLVKGLGIRGAEDYFFLDVFVESLALLNEGNGIRKQANESVDWEE